MNAYAYLRVSTDAQADSGAGIAAQAATIATFAKSNGLTVVGTFEDAGVSGAAALDDRPGLLAVVSIMRKGDVLIVAKRDRLGRDQMAVLMIERAIAKRGATIMSADGVGNGDDAGSVFMRQVIDAASCYERNLIRSRTKAALAAKRKAGERTGEVPFGWNLDADGRLVENADEQRVLACIVDCRNAGLSLRKIAGILMSKNVRTKKGRAVWHACTVQSILERHDALAS